MHRSVFLLPVLVAILLSTPAWVQGGDANSLQKEIDKLTKKRNELYAKYTAIQKKYKEQKNVKNLHEVSNAANATYRKMEATDARVLAARKDLKDAYARRTSFTESQLARHTEGAKIFKQLAQLNEQRQDLEFQKALANFYLTHTSSPVARALAKDTRLAGLREKAYASTAKERAAAWKTYEQTRQARLNSLPQSKPHLDTIERVQKSIELNLAAQTKAKSRLAEIRQVLLGLNDNRAIDAANKRVAEALASGKLKKARQEHYSASSAYSKLFNELMAKDENAKTIHAQLGKLGKQIQELQNKQRLAAK